jgi:two-component system sensor kinase FixL
MSAAKYLRDGAIFVPCYVALDWASYIDPVAPFNITPWNPQPALAIAWMMLAGIRFAPAVFAAIVIADIVVRDMPGGYGVILTTAVTLAAGYAGIALAARSVLDGVDLRSTRQLTLFVAVLLAGTALVGAAFIGELAMYGLIAEINVLDAWLRFWIGDAVGELVALPLLLGVANAERRRSMLAQLRGPEAWAQFAILLMTVWIIFEGLGGDVSRHFYLLFLPLIWIATRSGLEGAMLATALAQVGIVLGLRGVGAHTVPVMEVQALVAALCLTALYLGMMVEERERATDDLRSSLRLAAAGETAGAIAHELNQPLTALANYGNAAQTLLAQGADTPQLSQVVARMRDESKRAAEVVRRIRNLFREGTTRLEICPSSDLLASTERIGAQVVGTRAIKLVISMEADVPPLYVDRMQIDLVLRNLLANAVDALEEHTPVRPRIHVSIGRHDNEQVRIVVVDNGRGPADAVRPDLFRPFASSRAKGMGLGLSVSRAIAEAHGGSLDARGVGRGEFHLVLPCAKPS